MRLTLIILVAMVGTGPTIAQQFGSSQRDYHVNGQGYSYSPTPSSVPNCAGCPGWINGYRTLDPGAPVAWLTASEGQIGWFTTPTNSVDIGPGGLSVILDGTDPYDPLAGAWATNANGDFLLTLPTTPALHGTTRHFAMLHFAATSPDGFWLSQTHHTSFDPTNALGLSQYVPSCSNSINLGDNDSVLVDIVFSFKFYGVSYTQCYVNSNGSVSFGQPYTNSAWTPSTFDEGWPRAAVWWCDLDPSNHGDVSYEINSITYPLSTVFTFTVSWFDVPRGYPSSYSGSPTVPSSNNFSLTLRKATSAVVGGQPDYHVIFDYGSLTAEAGVVGITPGGSPFGTPSPTPVALDLSAAPNALGGGASYCYYEEFLPSIGGPNPVVGSNPDLLGQRVDFDLNGSGYPETQY